MAKQIEFNRPTKYKFIEELGAGACGKTVRLRDTDMDLEFVAKKYRPFFEEAEDVDLYDDLLSRFRDEARILFRLNHPNVVRVYNFYDYREIKTAYIIMEYVAGAELHSFLAENPFSADRVFEGIVDGFAHLQSEDVLHRDIRPANILVARGGVPKIIDFGFGKVGLGMELAERPKSISLNWWCETPPEFVDNIYDFQTEVYFVGKLFEQILSEGALSEFKYKTLVGKMCEPDRNSRIASFQKIQSEVSLGKFAELSFTDSEINTYRRFADELSHLVSSVQSDARFERDSEKVIVKLEELHRIVMLEQDIPQPNKLAQIFIVGAFKYWTKESIEVATLLKFIELLRGLSEEKRGVVLENLTARLEACERTQSPGAYGGYSNDMEDEIPF